MSLLDKLDEFEEKESKVKIEEIMSKNYLMICNYSAHTLHH